MDCRETLKALDPLAGRDRGRRHARKALTSREFQEILTVCQVLPGPTLVSLAMYLGRRLFGPGESDVNGWRRRGGTRG